jgi:hypothetical protein
VSEFVDECRREWRRLGVPDPIANEMAADLAADLAEAEADGVSAEEVLGTSAFDPRAFAAAWAVERGVVPPEPVVRARSWKRSLAPAAIVAVLAIAAVVAGAAILSRGTPSRLAVAPVAPPRAVFIPPARVRRSGVVPRLRPIPRLWVRVARPTVVPLPTGSDLHPYGWLLLFVGLGGIAFATYWSVRGARRPAPS